MRIAIGLAGAIASLVIVSPSSASQVIQNGDFGAGLTGWTSYLTSNGTISPTTPNQGGVSPTNSPAETASFDVKGTGASNALWLNAGQYLPPYGTANPAGGGVFQTFTSVAGMAVFAADIAVTTRFAGDTGGVFSVLLDGIVLNSVDFGSINGTTRSTLGFTTNLAAGSHSLALQVVRPFAPAVGLRSQYFDNVSLNVTAAVPEIGSWAMMIVGLGAVGGTMRHRRHMARAAVVA